MCTVDRFKGGSDKMSKYLRFGIADLWKPHAQKTPSEEQNCVCRFNRCNYSNCGLKVLDLVIFGIWQSMVRLQYEVKRHVKGKNNRRLTQQPAVAASLSCRALTATWQLHYCLSHGAHAQIFIADQCMHALGQPTPVQASPALRDCKEAVVRESRKRGELLFYIL